MGLVMRTEVAWFFTSMKARFHAPAGSFTARVPEPPWPDVHCLITGLAGFSVITSATLWYFCISRIALQGEYAQIGRAFGSGVQLALAWVRAFAFLPVLLGTVYLASRAYRLPKSLVH